MRGYRLFLLVCCVFAILTSVSASQVNWTIGTGSGPAWNSGTTDGTNVNAVESLLELETVDGSYLHRGNYTSIWGTFGDVVSVRGIGNQSLMNENHSMDVWIRSAGAPDESPSAWYSNHSDVPANKSLQVRARLVTTNNTSTPQVANLTVVGHVDSTPPVISLDSQPDTISANDTLRYEGSLDERGNVFYSIDDNASVRVCSACRSFSFTTSVLEPGNHSVTLTANDTRGNEIQLDKWVSVANGSEVSFDLGVDRSYPDSGIPIDPDSEVWDVTTDVDFNFTLQADDVYDISNSFDDGVCDFNGDEGWHLNGNYYCGSRIPQSIDTDATYELVAEWELRGNHSRVIHDSIEIGDTYIWQDQAGNHGGRVVDTVTTNMEFDGETEVLSDGSIATCSGSRMRVTDIGTHEIQCSNGATDIREPPVVSFIYDEQEGMVNTSNNDMFGGGCSIHDGITREMLRGEIGAHMADGYLPKNCDLYYYMDGTGSFVVQNFTESGNYKVYVDLVNAVSDSPDFICPARTDNNDLCSFGSLVGDESGWESIESYNVTVLNASAEVSSMQFSSNVQYSNGYIARTDYEDNVNWTADIVNTGFGPMNVTSASIDCPPSVTCSVETSLPLHVSEGGSALIDGEMIMPDGGGLTGYANITVTYDTGSDLSCGGVKQVTESIRIDEESPVVSDDSDDQWHSTVQEVNLSCSDDGSGCDGISYCKTQSATCSPSTDYTGTILVNNDGVTTINYTGRDAVGNRKQNSTAVKKDTKDPRITCNDCFSSQAVSVGSDVTVDPDIDTRGLSSIADLQYCSDASCQQSDVLCSFQFDQACTFTRDQYTTTDVYVRAEDQAGNIVEKELGSVNFLLGEDEVCQEDNQCVSDVCESGRCQGEARPPDVEFLE